VKTNISDHSDADFTHGICPERIEKLYPKLVDKLGKLVEGGLAMAKYFKILSRRNGTNLNLDLSGDFDGTSAYELLYFLDKTCCACDQVFINTDRLKKVYPFGQEILNGNWCLLHGKRITLNFLGRYAREVVPDWGQCAQSIDEKTIIPGDFPALSVQMSRSTNKGFCDEV